jgi:hypothetical protein
MIGSNPNNKALCAASWQGTKQHRTDGTCAPHRLYVASAQAQESSAICQLEMAGSGLTGEYWSLNMFMKTS